MLLQLLFYYGFLQTVHNLLRFLQIDAEVFRCRTSGESFNRANSNRVLFTILSDALLSGFKYSSTLGAPKAIVAMAHHLARLVDRMLRYESGRHR